MHENVIDFLDQRVQEVIGDVLRAFDELWPGRRSKPHDHTEEGWEALEGALDKLRDLAQSLERLSA